MTTSPHFRNHQLTIKIDTNPGGQFIMIVEDNKYIENAG